MTDQEILAESDLINPFKVKAEDGRIVINWGDDPLDFISICRARAVEFMADLQAAIEVTG